MPSEQQRPHRQPFEAPPGADDAINRNSDVLFALDSDDDDVFAAPVDAPVRSGQGPTAPTSTSTGGTDEPLPDLLLETTVVDVRFRSQSVPVLPEQEARLRRQESIHAVAMGLRRIGDEIDGGGGSSQVFVMRRLRGYSISGAERPSMPPPPSSSSRQIDTAAAAAFSYPGDPSPIHQRDGRRRVGSYSAGAGGSGGARRDSWIDCLSRMLRTISGADIADADAAANEASEEEGGAAGGGGVGDFVGGDDFDGQF